MQLTPVEAIAAILIASFAIDRIVAGLFFVLSYNDHLRPMLNPASIPDAAAREVATRDYRVLYTAFAAYLGMIVVAGFMGLRVFASTQRAQSVSPVLDVLLTGLLLAGGADRIADALKMFGGPEVKKRSEQPIEITGRLLLERPEGESADKARGAGQNPTVLNA